MSVHLPILPTKAIAITEAAGFQNAKAILADFAAAGLIKAYALASETTPAGGPAATVRDAQIPADVWQRIVTENKVSDALNGGTIRVQGSHLRGGTASVQITGVSFSETSLLKVLEHYCKTSARLSSSKSTLAKTLSPAKPTAPVAVCKAKKVVPPIMPGDLLVSIAQTMQATGLGRTKVNNLIKQKILITIVVGRRTLVTVESIERFAGVKVTP